MLKKQTKNAHCKYTVSLKTMSRKISGLVVICFAILFVFSGRSGNAQVCNSTVPNFSFDFSGHPDSVYNTPSVVRKGNCCGTTSPDRCIHFDMILDAKTAAVNFTITSGAIPT